MKKEYQFIAECSYCGRIFENGEAFYQDALSKCYCYNNKCGWENEKIENRY